MPRNKFLLLFLSFTLTVFATAVGITESEQIKADERQVKASVLEWADSVFYFHEDYRFEHFHAHYTDEFYIVMLRSDLYKKKIDDLKLAQENGEYAGSEAEYVAEMDQFKRKWEKFQVIVDSFVDRVRFFEIVFWSNIKTQDGYMVYCSHKFKLSHHFLVMSATIKSMIGNKRADNGIRYKKY